MTGSRRTKNLTIACTLMFVACFFVACANSQEIQNTVFSPLYIDNVSYEIFNDDLESIGNVTDQGGFAVYRDPDHVYPTVECYVSDPFLTDSSGLVIQDPAREALDPTTLQVSTNGDKLLFLKKFYFGIDYGVRLYSSLPDINYFTIPISPLDNYQHSHQGNSWSDVFGDCGGVILADVFTGSQTGTLSISHQLSGVSVQNALYPIDLTPTDLRDTALVSNDLSNAINNLTTGYGNSPVIVRPKFSLNAISDLITYNYQKTLENGSTIIVKTSSADMGFYDVDHVTQYDRKGIIPNELEDLMQEENYEVVIPDESLNQITDQVGLPVNQQGLERTRSYEAHFQYTSSFDRTYGGSSRIFTSINTNVRPRQIDLNNFSLPNQANITTEFELSPLTTLTFARYNLKYVGWLHDEYGLLTEDTLVQGFKDIEFPYRLRIDNTYAVTRIVVEVAVLTENDATVILADGTPIDINDFTDFDINAFGLTPDFNDADATVTTREANPLGISAAVWNIVLTIIIIIAVISVVGMILFFQFIRGGGGGVTNIVFGTLAGGRGQSGSGKKRKTQGRSSRKGLGSFF